MSTDKRDLRPADWRELFEDVQVMPSINGLPDGVWARWSDPETLRRTWHSAALVPFDPAKVPPRIGLVAIKGAKKVGTFPPSCTVFCTYFGKPERKVAIHHIDGNGHDHAPHNLVAMPRDKHMHLHAAIKHAHQWHAEDPERFRRTLRDCIKTMQPRSARGRAARVTARLLPPHVTAALGVSEWEDVPTRPHLLELAPEVQRFLRLYEEARQRWEHWLAVSAQKLADGEGAARAPE